MKLTRFITLSGLMLMLASGASFAEKANTAQRPSGGGGDRGGDRGGVRESPAPRYRSGSEPSHNYRAPIPSNTNTNPPPNGGGNQSGGGYTGYYLRYNDWYYANNFLYNLWYRYPYFAVDNYAWRYSVGDSPIDRNIVRLALQDSHEAANGLVSRVAEMSALIDDYEAGKIERAVFQKRFDASLDMVRKLAKSIRKDDRLEYLDQRKGIPFDQPEKATSVPELRTLVQQLHSEAQAMRDGLESYYVKDYTRTVDLEHLKQPSFKSMSERIDKLAKSIEKSAGKM